MLERALLRRVRASRPVPADLLVRAAVDRLQAPGGAPRIEALAQALGVSRQHLAALFRERVGLSAKTFAMVCRFRRASALARETRQVDWAGLADACGYYDQAHLIHDFQAFAGQAPEAFMRRG